MAIDPKYGRVTLEHGTIGEDEVVVVFRATDEHLPRVLTNYLHLCSSTSPQRHLDLILSTLDTVTAWQKKNETRTPTSEGSREWLDK